MTISKLIKELEKIKKNNGPRTQVTICKKGMSNLDNSDYSHISIQSIQSAWIRWSVDDSWELKDGTERMRYVAVLK